MHGCVRPSCRSVFSCTQLRRIPEGYAFVGGAPRHHTHAVLGPGGVGSYPVAPAAAHARTRLPSTVRGCSHCCFILQFGGGEAVGGTKSLRIAMLRVQACPPEPAVPHGALSGSTLLDATGREGSLTRSGVPRYFVGAGPLAGSRHAHSESQVQARECSCSRPCTYAHQAAVNTTSCFQQSFGRAMQTCGRVRDVVSSEPLRRRSHTSVTAQEYMPSIRIDQ